VRDDEDPRQPAISTTGLLADPQLRFRDPLAPLARRLGWPGAFLLGVIVYGVGEKIILPILGGYFTLEGDLSTWRPDIEALVSGFLFVPTIFAAYVWQINGIRSVFAGFAREESFADKAALAGFIARAHRWFGRHRWWMLSVLIAAIGVFVQGWWLWDPENPKPVPPWWEEGEPLARIVALSLAPLLWYAAAQIIIGEVRLAWTLRRLWREVGGSFVLRGRQYGGGMRSLSRHVGILTTIGAVVLLNLVLGALLPQIRASDASPDFNQWLWIIWIAYLIVVPGLTLAMVWPAHRVMSAKKDERLRVITNEINNELAGVDSTFSDPTALAASMDRIEGLRRLRLLLRTELPRWPLPNLIRAVSWSAVVPTTLSVLTTLLDQFS
jgi:hypothetical protein